MTTTPTTYAIRVDGHLDDHWSAWLGELDMTRNDDRTTTITVPVSDQAQLHGVLAGLRDIGAVLTELRTIGAPAPTSVANDEPLSLRRANRCVRSRAVVRSPRGTAPNRPVPTLENMTIKRMDNVGIVVDDLAAATSFFVELGLELEGETSVEGSWADRVVGLDGVRVDVAMVRMPDGHGRLELMKFHTPAAVSGEQNAPANTLGIRRIMFAVDDLEEVLARLRAHGAELVGEVAQYEDTYRLCYVRGPEGIIVALAEQLR